MYKAWLVGAWCVVGAVGLGCSGDTDTDDGDTDVADTDTDTTPECTGPENGTSAERITTILCLEGDIAAGETFYAMNCAACHRLDGTGIDGEGGTGANLTLSPLNEPDVVATVFYGIDGSDMDAYHPYQNQQLADVTTYVWETFIKD